jgi:hypothetical protein
MGTMRDFVVGSGTVLLLVAGLAGLGRGPNPGIDAEHSAPFR